MAFNLLLKPQLERVINTLEPQIHTYAVSSTSRNVVDKVAVLNGFILGSGAKVLVKFTDTTTTDPSSGNITLNVNSTGAKTVKISETDEICTYENASAFCDNKVYEFVYDGTNWIWIANTVLDADVLITTNEFESLIPSSGSEITSLASWFSTENSMQNSQISSLSSSASELASTVSSLSTSQSEIDSNQNSLLSSLSTANSEFTSELNILGSEVADKQDELTAGKGITIANDVINADTNIFYGTLSEWDELTSVQKANYDYISTPEEDVVDNDSGWLQVGTSGLYYRKVYKTLFIRFSNINITRDGNVAIVETLPQEYRPSYDFLGTAFYSSYGATKATLVVNTNGTVYLSGLAYETATTLSNVYGYAVGVI